MVLKTQNQRFKTILVTGRMILSMRFCLIPSFETFKVFGKFTIYSNKFIRINIDKFYFAGTL